MPISELFANFEKQCNEVFIFAHANANPSLTIPSMKKIFLSLISGERKLFDLVPCLQELIQESYNSY